jgi:TPP-dependent pyruvate/acetoin dehydrogenase alpha subunit
VRATVSEAVDRARAGDGPTFIEALSYRHKGHSRTDPGTYRPQEEVDAWLARDPIPAFERVLVAEGVPVERVEAAREAATAAVGEHLERALAWPDPAPAARFDHVYA